MPFEFDAAKSIANKFKHGVDFEEAQRLWMDPRLLEAPARTADEPRFLAVGMIGGKHWSAIFTRRGRSTAMKARAFDRKFDGGGDVSDQIDWSKASRRANTAAQLKRVNVDFPLWVVEGLDRKAGLLGVTRQALIKLWIAERLG